MKSFELSFEYNESPAANKTISVFTYVTFDDVKMEGILDINQFFQSLTFEGFIPLFTCDCGSFGCGGYYVQLKHSDHGLSLENRYRPHTVPDEKDLINSCSFFISWEDAYFIGRQLLDVLDEILDKWHDFEICSGTLGIDLVSKVRDYEKLLEKVQIKF